MSLYYVIIYHGVCNTFHSLEHKPQFVAGLRDRLQKLGYRTNLVKVPYLNYCMVAMCDHEIFRCNLKHLKFNTHYTRDVVAQRAIAAVLAMTAKLNIAFNHLWFRTLLENEMFARNAYSPKDYWPVDITVETPYVKCNKCVVCCDIALKKIDEKEEITADCEHICTDVTKVNNLR